MKRILSGTIVLDLTRFFSGPQATLLLAAMGAEVIKVDDPKTGDPTAFSPPLAGPNGVSFNAQTDTDMGIAYLKRARGKKSINLDLKSEAGLAVFKRLVAAADVVIDNFSVGVLERLGLDYQSLSEVNSSIICCSLTGYGSTGPDRGLKAYDLMVQAAVGLMSVTGEEGAPPVKAGSPISDAIAGVFAANGIVAALLHRERTGEGQAIDVSMADCLFSLIFDEPFDCYEQLGIPQRQGSRIMRFSPFNSYQTLDGWVVLGTANDGDWHKLLGVIDRSDLHANPDMMSLSWRLANNRAVDTIVAEWTKTLSTSQIVERMMTANIPCSPVRSISDVMSWEQLAQRDMFNKLWNPLAKSHVAAFGPGFPIKFSATPADYSKPAPLPGEHTNEILARLAGLNAEEIQHLADQGTIR
ncbi:CaiB/BaiF CoA-transferase family protein [Pusillimonas sp. T7-7]|uniref:CaiB/BaiF CoA transferase family protein n=1 Tax=Pusillimonas sp. (strain T7-7) TaxID=1007105 RepID=UPI0013054668|nr:CoA transferase [Pusillimonas sp. T7-7]